MKTEQTGIGAIRHSTGMISLECAVLCVNCELISGTERDCPRCGSRQLMPMVQMIGGSLFAVRPSAASAMGSTIQHSFANIHDDAVKQLPANNCKDAG
jgi:hypothetical protein